MTQGNMLVWRIRLCLVLTAAALVHVNTGKNASHKREQMAATAIPVKCAAPPARSAAPLQDAAFGHAPAAEAGNDCGRLASPAAIRTTNRPIAKPDVVSPRFGALAAR
jgi:hypothetical protein